MPGIESVTANRILDSICLGESVRRMREAVSGDDLDILEVGSRRERIRFEGAGKDILSSEVSRRDERFQLTAQLSWEGEHAITGFKRAVELVGQISGELEVLCLILTNGDVRCPVKEGSRRFQRPC